MIPKVIHYCWFGGSKLPSSAKKCIRSWKKYCPDFEIKEWNENNFDVNCCDYVKEAYKKKKWAFVSDFARFWILYNYGGVYFDTDVELLKPMDHILNAGPFMGREDINYINPGLGIAAPAGLKLYKEIVDSYLTDHFVDRYGVINLETVVTRVTDILRNKGFSGKNKIEIVDGIYIYPTEYFCPLNLKTREINITCNTYAIHHYTASWYSSLDRIINKIENTRRIKSKKIKRIVSLLFRILNKLDKNGVRGTIIFIYKNIKQNDKHKHK